MVMVAFIKRPSVVANLIEPASLPQLDGLTAKLPAATTVAIE